MKIVKKFWLIITGMILLLGCGDREISQENNNIPATQEAEKSLQKDIPMATKTPDKNSKLESEEQKLTVDVADKEENQIKEYIQEAINNANLLADDDFFISEDGEIFCQKRWVNYAYSYFGKEIKQLRSSPSSDYIAILKDGSVYNGTTLITNEYKVKDIIWRTNNINIDAYLLTEDGQILYYFPYDGTCQLQERLGNIVAGCRYRSDLIFLDKDGNAYPEVFSEYSGWSECNINKWKNVVVMACTQNREEGTASIAAIAADGTVYATGDYSEEILSWGELAYISMDEELIVGLKKDGTLAFAGTMADKFAKAGFQGINAVRVWSGNFFAMTEKGFISTNIYDFDNLEKLTFLNHDTSKFSYLKIDQDGNVYQPEKYK